MALSGLSAHGVRPCPGPAPRLRHRSLGWRGLLSVVWAEAVPCEQAPSSLCSPFCFHKRQLL